MDKLFIDLFKTIDAFLRLAKLAPTKISTDGLASNMPTPKQRQDWYELIKGRELAYTQLKIFSGNVESNKLEVDRALAAFRDLPNCLEERWDCDWSAYCDDIMANLGERHDLLIDIDTKYKLGQHRND